MDEYSILMHPIVTEKSTQLAALNQYVFKVDSDATKFQIRDAVQKIFKVKVTGISTVNVHGKLKRRGMHWVRQTSYKKAIITVAKGSTIDPSKLG